MNPFSFLRRKSAGITTGILPFLAKSINFDKTKGQFLNYNEISLYVNRALSLRAEKVGEVEFILLDKNQKEVERNEFIDALNNPNEFHTGKQFWSLVQKYYDLCGEAYIYVNKGQDEIFGDRKIELHVLRPDLVRKVMDQDKTKIVSYEYSGGNETISYAPDEIIYYFNADPKKPLDGVSLLQAGIRSIETEVQLSEYHAKVIQNGGQVDGVFKFKGNLTKQQIAEMKEVYKVDNAGAKNAGIPMFLGGDADYVRMGLNPAELSFLESKQATLDDISILTGVPKSVMGSFRDMKYDNADASLAIFLRETIKPLLFNLTSVLDWRFIPEQYDLSFKDPTPENIDRKMKMIETADKTYSVSINEKRAMLGLEPRKEKEADEIFMPFNLTSMTATEDNTKSVEVKKKSELVHPLRDKEVRRKYAEIQVKKLDNQTVAFREIIREYFNKQRIRIINNLEGRKQFKKKELFDEVFNFDLEVDIAKITVLPVLRRLVEEAGIETFDFLGNNFDFSVTGDIASWVENRANVFAKEINDTTFERLKNQFTESFEQNEPRSLLIERIESVYINFDQIRATTIARTEVHSAVQKGNHEAYKQAGFTIKIWVWGVGIKGGVRDNHLAMDGEEKPMNMPFSNGLMFAGDPDGGAGEIVNCECST